MSTFDCSSIKHFLTHHDIRTLANIPGDVICSICNRTMVDACFALCSCRYCYGCIKNSLKTSKFCPGNGKQCKKSEIDMKTNIKMDDYVNQRIANLEIKCPTDHCVFEDTICNMTEHLRICSKQPEKCPFYDIGCEYSETTEDNITAHINSCGTEHSRMLIECLLNFKNQLDHLMEKEEKRREFEDESFTTNNEEINNQESRSQKNPEKSNNKLLDDTIKTATQQQEINILKNEMQKQLKIINELKDQVKPNKEQILSASFEEQLKVLKNLLDSSSQNQKRQQETISSLQRDVSLSKEENIQLKHQMDEIVSTIKGDERLYSNCNRQSSKSPGDGLQRKSFSVVEKLRHQNVEFRSFTLKPNKETKVKHHKKRIGSGSSQDALDAANIEFLYGEISKLRKQQNELQRQISQQICGEFLWKIENLADKRRDAMAGKNKDLFSESFYSHKNGYKLFLRIAPNSMDNFEGSHIWIGFSILRGEFDDLLDWPCMYLFEISVLRMNSGKPFKVQKYDYNTSPENWKRCFDRPTSERNYGFGNIDFLKWDDILVDDTVCKNDMIFVRCQIFPPL